LQIVAAATDTRLRAALIALGLGAIAAAGVATYLAGRGDAVTPATHSAGGVGWAASPQAVPQLAFVGTGERGLTLADFRGKLVLVNIWATWCAPCREEMPALDRLQQTLGGPDFEVVALSIDREGMAVVRRFYDEIGMRALAPYVDPSMRAGAALRILGVPTTLLLDRQGRERWRKTGPEQWDSPEIVAALRARIRVERVR
jgi:thiol-disulfide isomerase/thioredoxin